jgi:membrane protein insertase Oxa1/YidC/SpoIIIJ
MANEIVGFGSLDSIELELINWNELYSTQYYSLLDSSKFISLQFQFNWTQMKPNLMQIGFNWILKIILLNWILKIILLNWILKIILLNWIQQNYENYEKVDVNLLFF